MKLNTIYLLVYGKVLYSKFTWGMGLLKSNKVVYKTYNFI